MLSLDFPEIFQTLSWYFSAGILQGQKYREQEKKGYQDIWRIAISYPDDLRIIQQSKEVDAHSLVGNIGGYVGLFLGNRHNSYDIC